MLHALVDGEVERVEQRHADRRHPVAAEHPAYAFFSPDTAEGVENTALVVLHRVLASEFICL